MIRIILSLGFVALFFLFLWKASKQAKELGLSKK